MRQGFSAGWIAVGLCLCTNGSGQDTALVVPPLSGSLATAEQLHQTLFPAWESLVENRNNAGLVGPKDEGKPQPAMAKEETAFQYERVQKGEVDSARLLLVFGMVPSTSYMDNDTIDILMQKQDHNVSDNLPALFDPQQRYPDGSTPLHMAAQFGRESSVASLLEARADADAVSGQGLRPIHHAAIMGHTATLSALAAHRADLDARHAFAGSTPLHFAAEMGHPGVVKRLCELGADVEAEKRHGGAAIHVSADTNNSAVTKVLVEEPCNADPEAVLLGDTVPLYLAAGRGFSDVINVLLDAGADPDRTIWPERPWQKNAKKSKKKKENKPASTELEEFKGNPAHNLPGSDPNGPGFEEGNGATSVHNACENGHLDAALALLDGGALQLATMQGVTPLITSLQYKERKIASALLDHRSYSNVHIVNPGDGQTALHVAAAYDYPEVVARILRDGGRTDVRDRRGSVPFDYARGRLSRWLLGQFRGRDPRLDAVARTHRDQGLEAELLAVEDASAEARDTYLRYARVLGEEGGDARLGKEVARLSRVSASGGVPREKEAVFAERLAVARFIHAGSEAHVAVEAMMQRNEEAMHVGLVLLGLRVRDLDYSPGAKLAVNGRDALALVNTAVSAFLQQGALSQFHASVQELRSLVEVVPGSRKGPLTNAASGQHRGTAPAERRREEVEQEKGDEKDEDEDVDEEENLEL